MSSSFATESPGTFHKCCTCRKALVNHMSIAKATIRRHMINTISVLCNDIISISTDDSRKDTLVHPEDDSEKIDVRKKAAVPDSSEVGDAKKVFIDPDTLETGSMGR